jgi:Fic family protein
VADALQPSRGRLERGIWQPSHDHGGARRHRRTQAIDCYIPDPVASWDPPLTAATAAILAEADAAVRDLNRDAPQFRGLEALSRQLLRQESVGSSRIEGLEMGQRRLARAAAGIGGDDTALQIVGNVRAMEQAIALAAEPRDVTLDDLLAVHRTLLDGTRDAHHGGVVRREQNWVGGSAFSPSGAEFIPPPEDQVDELMADLVAFVNRDDLPVVLQAAIAHAQFETIHPFADGNGRAGRCLIHVIYRRRELAPNVVPPISLVLATRADQYIGGLEEYRYGDAVEWLVFFAVATISAARKAGSLATRIQELGDTWLARVGNPRSDASSRKIIERLPAEPILTVARAAAMAAVSNTAADNAVRILQEAGILKPLNEQRWGRRWEAPDIFALLDDFERELATPDGDDRPARPAARASRLLTRGRAAT